MLTDCQKMEVQVLKPEDVFKLIELKRFLREKTLIERGLIMNDKDYQYKIRRIDALSKEIDRLLTETETI